MPNNGKHRHGDIGIFENELFGPMTIFYDDFSGGPFGGAWLIWTEIGMRNFRVQYYPDIDLSIFRGGV